MTADAGLVQKKQRSGEKQAGWVARTAVPAEKCRAFKR